jgi:hypothetical protein
MKWHTVQEILSPRRLASIIRLGLGAFRSSNSEPVELARAKLLCVTILGLLLSMSVSTSAPRSDTSASGTHLDVAKMRLTFSEEFDTLDVSPVGPGTRWIAHTPWGGDFGDAVFVDPEPGFPFVVRDGVLRIEAKRDPAGRWRSGLLASADAKGEGFSQQYGYFEMRAKLPKGKGLWPAFWLSSIAQPNRPASVEVDALEAYGQFPDAFNSGIHVWFADGNNRGEGPYTHHVPSKLMYEHFNNYGALVTPEWIVFYFNRAEYWRVRTPTEHKLPLLVLLNLALGSGWPIDEAPSPSYMFVDHVRVYTVETGRATSR